MSSGKGLKWRIAQSLEYIWWQRYLKKKDPEQYLQWKDQYWQKLLLKIHPLIGSPENKKILDAGCGPAGIFMSLNGNSVHAIDPLLDKYDKLAHFQPGRFPWTSFQTMTMESMLDNHVYDLIFCLNAINHVKDVETCYRALAKALKPGGILVISTDAHRYGLLKKIFQLLPGDMLHPVQLDIDEYAALLTSTGLNIKENILYKPAGIFNYYVTVAHKPE